MYLSAPHDTTFELSIGGYQYPQTKHERYDSDWLEIAIRVTDPRGNWSSTDPIMLTWEVALLTDWFEALTAGHLVRSSVSFVEPNLRFELMEQCPSHHIIRVYFEQESRPPWDPSRFGFAGIDVASIELHATADDLRQAARALRAQLQQFPLRVGRNTATFES